MNKAALFYVWTTRDSAYCFVSQMFLLDNCSFAFHCFLCFVHGQGQRTKETENKNIYKEIGEFHKQSRFTNYVWDKHWDISVTKEKTKECQMCDEMKQAEFLLLFLCYFNFLYFSCSRLSPVWNSVKGAFIWEPPILIPEQVRIPRQNVFQVP